MCAHVLLSSEFPSVSPRGSSRLPRYLFQVGLIIDQSSLNITHLYRIVKQKCEPFLVHYFSPCRDTRVNELLVNQLERQLSVKRHIEGMMENK